jgi:hypothetical protein
MSVSLNDKQITLNEFMENAKSKMGDKFLSYNANTNKCQALMSLRLSGGQWAV